MRMHLGEVLYRPEDRIEWVYFPESCLLSLLSTTRDGESVETAMVGTEGATGLIEACGSGRSSLVSLVQIDGEAIRAPAGACRDLVASDPEFGRLVWKLVELQMTESRQSGLCQAVHAVEPRLARWLLECSERCDGRNPMPLTQEFIAAMLGVQRTTVTAIASQLQKSGLIAYRRGKVEIVDYAGLEQRACECREVTRHERARLGFEPLPHAGGLGGSTVAALHDR
jgi:CRP-like cAMP-binding protein